MFITNDDLPATRDFTLLSIFYMGSMLYTLMPLFNSAAVIALRTLGDTVMSRGKAHNKALDTLWELVEEVVEDAEAEEAMGGGGGGGGGDGAAGDRRYRGQGLTLVPISAQLELFCPLCNPTRLMNVSWSCST